MRNDIHFIVVLLLAAPLSLGVAAQDQTIENEAQKEKTLEEVLEEQALRVSERVNVIGSEQALERIPGSAYVIDAEELDRQKQGLDDVHRILRRVPGVVVQEEDGYGLRPNIGMRGSGSERSAKITLMEDGVLIAPAPYAAPSAYYFPVVGRMESIEVLKGSSQIQFGPRTNGGALNLISAAVPTRFNLEANVALGHNDALKGHARVGDSGQRVGWLFETYQLRTDGFKQLDGGGGTGFHTQDYLGKLRFNTSPTARIFQSIELKLGAGTQDADETYLGLTDSDFEAQPLRRYAASQPDNIQWDHRQFQVQHFLATPNGLDVTTTVYRNDFSRNWYKLQSVLGTGLGDLFDDPAANSQALEIARGASSGVDALKVRANNRTYVSQGIQSVVGLSVGSGETKHDLELGVRYHADEEDRLQWEDGYQMTDGSMNRTSTGTPGSQSNRVSGASALALFVRDTLRWSRLSLLPGLRYETMNLVRKDFSTSDPQRSEGPSRVRDTPVSTVIPGVGVTFDIAPRVRLIGGVHRGFSPPGPGADAFTAAEKSVNYEAGFRTGRDPSSAEVVFYFTDYNNLLGADTLSGGGTGEGDLVNGGKARAMGLEAAVSLDFASGSHSGIRLPFRASYTFTDAEFQNAFVSDYAPWGSVAIGDELPYLSPHQLYASMALEAKRWIVGADVNVNARMRTVASQGPINPKEATDTFAVVNVFGEIDLADHVRAFANVQNIGGASYIVARRPAGARPGLPRTLMMGLKLRVGR